LGQVPSKVFTLQLFPQRQPIADVTKARCAAPVLVVNLLVLIHPNFRGARCVVGNRLGGGVTGPLVGVALAEDMPNTGARHYFQHASALLTTGAKHKK